MSGSSGAEMEFPLAAHARRDLALYERRKLTVASTACLVVGLVALVSAYSPWWYTSTTSSGTSSMADFYPGYDIHVSGGGGGGVTSYGSSGLPSVGVLYLLVVLGTIALALTAWVVAAYGLGASRRRWGSVAGRRAARTTLLATVVLSLLLAVVVPTAQPALYRADDPSGSCTSGSPPGACGSFWGTVHSGGATTTWGAGLGWWLDLACAGLLLLAFSAAIGTVRPAVGTERSRTGP